MLRFIPVQTVPGHPLAEFQDLPDTCVAIYNMAHCGAEMIL